MLSLTYDDVNEAYTELQTIKWKFGEWEDTRNGRALVFNTPVCIEHAMPYRRVLFDKVRDANPFFHYMEAIWMLAGREDVYFPSKFAKNIANYSDDGSRLHGAYGFRWRSWFDLDQIQEVINELFKNPTTRRAVIGMWDPSNDLARDSKDLPCNTHIYFRTYNGRLNMTVCNRSNDLVWGMLGANMVHMSILHEYIATTVGMVCGSYYQFTNNLHVYEDWTQKYDTVRSRWYDQNPAIPRIPFSVDALSWPEAADFCEAVMDGTFDVKLQWSSPIIQRNARPMVLAWEAYKGGDIDLAQHYAAAIYDADWGTACDEWLQRRLEKVNDQEG
jgi:thymidylate synthase